MTDPWAPPDRQPSPSSWGAVPTAGPPRPWTWLTTDVLVVGIASLLVLGASSSLAVTRRAERPSVDLRAAQAQLERRLPELSAYVEQERGLRFREPVDARVLDDDAFVAALFSGEETEDDSDPDATLTALGLLDEDEDLGDVVDEALGSGVVGFYDTDSDELVVRGEAIDPYVEMVLVHELVHALQDQVFDLDRDELEDADDERFTGFQSLVEGDASRVESAWRASRPADVRADIDREEQRRFGSGSQREPSVVDVLLGFPYFAGEPLVEALLADGQERLDRAFRDPPTTTEQVLRPDDPDLEPVVVPDPTGPGEVVDEGVLGAAGLALLTLSDPTADGPHLGWDGDRYATFDDDGEVCTVVDVVAEGTSARDALVAALADWAGSVDGTVEPRGDEALRLRSCTS